MRRLEQAVTRRLWQVLDNGDLIDHAITETYECLTQREDEQHFELAGIQDKLTETRAALDRYFRAFDAGTMPEDTYGIRVDARDQIEPTFRVPAVRIVSGYMELVGLEPTTS